MRVRLDAVFRGVPRYVLTASDQQASADDRYWRAVTLAPLLARATLDASDLLDGHLEAHLSAWGAVDLAVAETQAFAAGDLAVAWARGTYGPWSLWVGRRFVAVGAARRAPRRRRGGRGAGWDGFCRRGDGRPARDPRVRRPRRAHSPPSTASRPPRGRASRGPRRGARSPRCPTSSAGPAASRACARSPSTRWRRRTRGLDARRLRRARRDGLRRDAGRRRPRVDARVVGDARRGLRPRRPGAAHPAVVDPERVRGGRLRRGPPAGHLAPGALAHRRRRGGGTTLRHAGPRRRHARWGHRVEATVRAASPDRRRAGTLSASRRDDGVRPLTLVRVAGLWTVGREVVGVALEAAAALDDDDPGAARTSLYARGSVEVPLGGGWRAGASLDGVRSPVALGELRGMAHLELRLRTSDGRPAR
jgi:hypothetical protein